MISSKSAKMIEMKLYIRTLKQMQRENGKVASTSNHDRMTSIVAQTPWSASFSSASQKKVRNLIMANSNGNINIYFRFKTALTEAVVAGRYATVRQFYSSEQWSASDIWKSTKNSQEIGRALRSDLVMQSHCHTEPSVYRQRLFRDMPSYSQKPLGNSYTSWNFYSLKFQ